MALAVLLFHYDKWLNGRWDASLPQGRLGVYAVSIFFVLSGLTLALAYKDRLDWHIASLKRFYSKRIWRIFPLLCLVTFCTLLIDDKQRSLTDVLLNFSGLFGWINPARDIATGAWSIGCELVYYAFFPLIFLVGSGWRLIVAVVLAGIGWVYFAFWGYDPALQAQEYWWPAYVQVLNHAVFFVAGVWMARSQWRIKSQWSGLLLVVVAFLFFSWPVSDYAFGLVYGYNRLVLSFLVLLSVWLYLMAVPKLEGVTGKVLAWLGLISYSLYLWHPVVFRGVQFIIRKAGVAPLGWQVFVLSLMGSMVLSHLSYRYFERWFMDKFGV